jgi:hypothetical protein
MYFYGYIFGRQYLRHLSRVLNGKVPSLDTAKLTKEIKEQAKEVMEKERFSIPDRQAYLILTLCAYVLASFQRVRKRSSSSEETFECVRIAFCKTFQTPYQFLTRIYLMVHKDPFHALSKYSMPEINYKLFGSSMCFEERKNDNQIDLIVTRCAFHSFFERYGEPQLTAFFVNGIEIGWMWPMPLPVPFVWIGLRLCPWGMTSVFFNLFMMNPHKKMKMMLFLTSQKIPRVKKGIPLLSVQTFKRILLVAFPFKTSFRIKIFN